MNPTDEQLRDPKWWDEVAPEDATHWCTLHNKWVYNPDWYDGCCIARPTKPAAPKWPEMPDKFYEGLVWMHAECCAALDAGEDPRGFEIGEMVDRCIQDLTRDPGAAWDGEGLPNVGEMVMHPRYGEPCKLRWIGKSSCVIESNFGDEYFAAMEDLEPIRTKEQRQRDELESIVSDAMIESAQEHSIPRAKDISSAVISAGWKKDA